MTNYDEILSELRKELKQSLGYLDFSYRKIMGDTSFDVSSKDPNILEAFEALVSRFARTSDIFMSKFLRALAERDDPAFRGTLRDWINYAEKKNVISSAQQWLGIRELRNKIAHEYAAKDISILFRQVLEATPTVLSIRDKIE